MTPATPNLGIVDRLASRVEELEHALRHISKTSVDAHTRAQARDVLAGVPLTAWPPFKPDPAVPRREGNEQ